MNATPEQTLDVINKALARPTCPLGSMPVMFRGKTGWRCIGYIKNVKTAKEAQPLADGLLIVNHLSAEKISIAEIDAGRFVACHG